MFFTWMQKSEYWAKILWNIRYQRWLKRNRPPTKNNQNIGKIGQNIINISVLAEILAKILWVYCKGVWGGVWSQKNRQKTIDFLRNCQFIVDKLVNNWRFIKKKSSINWWFFLNLQFFLEKKMCFLFFYLSFILNLY